MLALPWKQLTQRTAWSVAAAPGRRLGRRAPAAWALGAAPRARCAALPGRLLATDAAPAVVAADADAPGAPAVGGESEIGEGEGGEGGEVGAVGTIVKRKKKIEELYYGIVHVQSTFNNTIVNITDLGGNTLALASGGSAHGFGYRGSRKKTPFAGEIAAEAAAEKAMARGVRSVRVKVKGIGRGRASALRALVRAGLEVTALEDVTPVPHNGCRPRKARRL